jgi:hypothetical protein
VIRLRVAVELAVVADYQQGTRAVFKESMLEAQASYLYQ